MLLVDQGNIRVGQGRQMMRSAVKFVDGLSPADRVAMVAIPQGALVDFTTNHERVREALLATVGLASPFKGRYHISLSEAIATVEHSDATLRDQLFLRECGGALMTPSTSRAARSKSSRRPRRSSITSACRRSRRCAACAKCCRAWAAIEGPKSVILISEGLVLEGLSSDVDDIAAIAADVRASLDVMLLDVPAVDVTESQRPTTPREDRDRQVEGLESLAGLSRGALHRVIVTGDNAFQRVMRSIAGHYLIGVEARPRDRDGRRHRIQVKSLRRGVDVYSRRGFLAPTSPAATSPADAVGRALRAPLTHQRHPDAHGDVDLQGAGRLARPPADHGRNRAQRAIRRSTTPPASSSSIATTRRSPATSKRGRWCAEQHRPRTRAVFAGSVMIDPGTYLLRMAFADSEGRTRIDRAEDRRVADESTAG